MNSLVETLWNEKYRPRVLQDCILPNALKQTFINFASAQNCPNIMIHSASGGTGKTTVLRALCNDLDLEYLFINASEQRSIDVIRSDVTQFVSTMSLDGRRKAVIFDECDSQTQIAQQALRSFIEQFSHIRFFFSCNFVHKIIQPLQSRCTVISFDWPVQDYKYLKNQFYSRVKNILTGENIDFNKDIVIELIRRFFPDFRRVINELQKHLITGCIDEGALIYSKELDLNDLMEILKNKKFNELRKWIETSETLNYEMFYKNFYSEICRIANPKCLPVIILILGRYIFQHSTIVDKQINLLCCLIEFDESLFPQFTSSSKETNMDEPEKRRGLFDIFHSLSCSKQMEDGDVERYEPFMTNRVFAHSPDTVFHANLMNRYSDLPIEAQIDYYLTATSAKKRYTPWYKPPVPMESIEDIRIQTGCSTREAYIYADLLDVLKQCPTIHRGGLSSTKSRIK